MRTILRCLRQLLRLEGSEAAPAPAGGGSLEKGWVIANHIFMSIHAAFLFPYYIDRILAGLGVHRQDRHPARSPSRSRR